MKELNHCQDFVNNKRLEENVGFLGGSALIPPEKRDPQRNARLCGFSVPSVPCGERVFVCLCFHCASRVLECVPNVCPSFGPMCMSGMPSVCPKCAKLSLILMKQTASIVDAACGACCLNRI